MDCKECKARRANEAKSVPYVVYEAEQDRAERDHNKLLIGLIIACLATIVSNIAWFVTQITG